MRLRTSLPATAVLAASLAIAASASASELVTLRVESRCIDPAKVVMAHPPPGKPERPPELRVQVTLPDGYDGERRFPVLYLLHGANSAYDYWLDYSDGELRAAVADLPAIVVMPESSIYGVGANHWNGGRRRPCFERYHLDELIPEIERRFQIRPARRWHAVGGLSGGGTGAVLYGAKKPGYFGQVLSFSGVLSLQEPEWEREAGLIAIYGLGAGPEKMAEIIAATPLPARYLAGDPDAQEFYWAAHNPLKLAVALRHSRVYVAHGAPTAPRCFEPRAERCALQDVGFGAFEDTRIRYYAERFISAAQEARVSVTYRPQTGGHWYSYGARFLADAIENWGLFKPVPENPRRWTYKTASQTGDMWGYRFRFTEPPEVVETFERNRRRLSGTGTGEVTIRTPRGKRFTETLPFERRLPR